MSWADMIKNMIINRQDKEHNHIYNNICDSGAIMGLDGKPWGSTVDPSIYFNYIKKEDHKDAAEETLKLAPFTSLTNAFKGGKKIVFNNKVFHVIMYDPNEKFVYLKTNGGGGCVALSGKAFVIGSYDTTKMMAKDGVQKAQNQGDCATAVLKMRDYLKTQGM